MMKMIRNKVTGSLILLLLTMNVFAQAPEISGVWVLKEKISLSGPDYANGLPKQFTIVLKADSILIDRLTQGASGDDLLHESLSLKGAPSIIEKMISVRQSTFKSGTGGNNFSIAVTYRDKKTGAPTNADFTEEWKIDGKELVIEKNAKQADGVTWSMKGIYELKTPEQIAAEQATGNGIQFTEGTSWNEIKARAKKEGKYIFVDCYATWCVPCKQMEKEIFPLDRVGAEMNDQFISVRLQMDTTKKDDANVKAWYATANYFLKNYQIVGYPSFLFFDADGNLVHKGLGSFKADEFIELLKEARDPDKQYYTLLKRFRAGERNSEKLYSFVLAAKKMREQKQAEEVLLAYKKSYLSKMPADSLQSLKYLKLAYDFPEELITKDGSKGLFFKLFYEKGTEVNAVLGLPGFSGFYLNYIITKEEIDSRVYKDGKPLAKPDWDKAMAAIKAKYPKVNYDKLILESQIWVNYFKKDWVNYIERLVKKIEKYGPLSVGQPDGQGSDNTIANALIPYCDDPAILNKAVGWMETIINSNAYMYPVGMAYGNYGAILYKAGKRKEGIEAFEKHIKAIGYTSPADFDKDPRLQPKIDYLERMKRGDKIDATWKPYIFN